MARWGTMDDTLTVSFEGFNRTIQAAFFDQNVKPYDGVSGSDPDKFIRNIEESTQDAKDETKCGLFRRKLAGSAETWPLLYIEEPLKRGAWPAVVQALLERFSAPDKDYQLRKKLADMSLDNYKYGLQSYVEEYYYLYKKVHQNAPDNEIVGSLNVNLPPRIILQLNRGSNT